MKQPGNDPEPLDRTRIQPNRPTSSGESRQDVPLPQQFELLGTLGQGGMGTVYKARNKYTERVVAIKVLSANNLSEEVLLRFQREAKMIAKLEHPNVVSLFDFGVAPDGSPYCVMEFTKGKDLGLILKEKGTLTEAKVSEIFVQVCAALSHAHQQGIIHRDLKPSNVILAEVGGRYKAKVLDFGIAKLSEPEEGTGVPGAPKLTKTGFIVGTPLYMAPEQCEGGKVDGRSDIYAIGAVMYQCLCGQPPHQGTSAIETMLLRMAEEPQSFKERGVKVSEGMEAIVRKCLQKNPEDRYASTEELSEALSGKRSAKKAVKMPKIVIPKPVIFGVIGIAALGALYTVAAPRITEQLSQLNLNRVDLNLKHKIDRDPVHVKTSHLSPRGLALLANDDKLQDLDLTKWDTLKDEQLDSISKLHLKSLILDESGVTDAGLGTVSKITSLESVSVANTKIDNLGVSQLLSSLPELKSLNISRTKVDPNVIGMLARNGSQSKLESIGLAGLPKVVHGNDLSKLEPLPLTALDLSGDDLDDSEIDTITTFQKLKSLNLDNNSQISLEAVQKLSKLPDLQKVSLQGIKIKPDALFEFRQTMRKDRRVCVVLPNDDEKLKDRLKKGAKKDSVFDFEDKNISDAGAAVLAQPQAKHAKVLNFANCYELGDAGVANFKGLTQLENLNLDSTSITNASVPTISSLVHLHSLSISDTAITELSEFSKLFRLVNLTIGQLKNIASIPNLGQMTELRKVWMPGSDAASARKFIAALKGSSVVDLNVADCGLDDSDIDAIVEAKQLLRVDLSGNDISGPYLMKFAKFHDLETLHLKNCSKITAQDIAQFKAEGPKHVNIVAP